MRKALAIPLALAALGTASCERTEEKFVTDPTTVSSSQLAQTFNSPAHHKGQDCVSCHVTWNLVAIHDKSSSGYNSDCISCHGDMSDETSLSSSVQAIHPRMCPYVYQAAGEASNTTTNAVCAYCHVSVDFVGGSAGNLRKQVAAENCISCHRLAGPGRLLYQ